ASGHFGAAGLNQRPELGLRKLPGGRNSEKDSGEQGYGGAEQHHHTIDVDRSFVRERVIGQHGGDGFRSAIGDQDADGRASDGQQNGFSEQLTDQSAAPRA